MESTRTTPEAPRLGTAQDLADLLQVPLAHAWRIGREQRIPGATVRIGRYLRFRLDVVERWLAEGGDRG